MNSHINTATERSRPAHSTLPAFVLRAMLVVLLSCAGARLPAQEPPSRLPHADLLLYHASDGTVRPVHSRSDWAKRRAEIVRGMEQVMGPMPGKSKRCPLAMKVEEEVDCGSYKRQLITYQSEPGSRVPAFLLVPKASDARRQAVLALHPTDMEFGHRVVVERLREHYRAYAADLAERGFIVLAPAYPLMADYKPDLEALGYQSGTMKAVWDNIRGVDLLESLPFVKKGGIGAIGHSLGGHNAIYTAVFEPRLKVIVSSCGFDSFLDYMGGKIRGWTSARYMPKLLAYEKRLEEIPFDFHEMLGALAPRPVLVNAPLGDTNFSWRSVDEVLKSARGVYQLYGVEKKLQVEHPDCGHDFPPLMREKAYRFLEENLK